MSERENKKAEELFDELTSKRKTLAELRFGNAGARAENPNEARSLRKDIARVKTELSRRKGIK